MLNSPCNPTGTVYTRRELEVLADVALEAKLSVLSDEIYEQLIYGEARATCFAGLRPELKESTITVSGASKSYSMTGWRMVVLRPEPRDQGHRRHSESADRLSMQH
jgi:aspartate aminotransferase